MIEQVELVTQIGFPIATAMYLLWERTKFNAKMIKTMEHITTVLDRIERRIP